MKSVLLIRHAKSSWDFNVDDFDRPLNHRGKTDAPEMAKRLLKKDIKIDAFVSSPAIRAFTTAALFAEAYGVKQKKIITLPSLYEADVDAFFDAIEGMDDDNKTIALFSHNPGITAFANKISNVTIDDMPTCAVLAVKADIKKWKDFAKSNKDFWFFDYPKADQ